MRKVHMRLFDYSTWIYYVFDIIFLIIEQYGNLYSFLNTLMFIWIMWMIGMVWARDCVYEDDYSTKLINSVHEVEVDGQCFPCLPFCRECSDVDDGSCSGGNCERGFFYSPSEDLCIACPVLCQQCTSATTCSLCIDGYYLDANSQCRSCLEGTAVCTSSSSLLCIEGYYYSTVSYTCQKCPTNCLSCQVAGCTLCDVGYMVDGTVCSSCADKCAECTIDQCTLCMQGYYIFNGDCVEYDCSGLDSCMECPSNLCTKCQEGYTLINGRCQGGASLMCAWASNNTDYGSCEACSEKAELAEDTVTFCIPVISDSQAVFNSYYTFAEYVLCDSPYILTAAPTTSISYTLAIKPAYKLTLQAILLSNSSQTIGIELDAATSSTSASWIKSTISCLSYELSTHRLSYSVYFSSQTNLSKVTFSSGNSFTLMELWMELQLCLVPACQQCSSKLVCQMCIDGYYVEEYGCVTQCGDGFYTNHYLFTCTSSCQKGYYENDDDMICQQCPSNCSECQSYSICTDCMGGYYLEEGECKQECESPYLYPGDNGICQACLNPCKTCSIKGDNCTSCKMGYLYMFSCVYQCPLGYYRSVASGTPACLQCGQNCLGCQIDAATCTRCREGMVLHQGVCIDLCPSGYYNASNICNKCLPPCEQCSSLNTCTLCLYGVLHIDTCVNICPTGYYHNYTNNSCDVCADSCLQCNSLEECVSCNNVTVLEKGFCVEQCSNGRVVDGVCEQCLYPCATCSSDECYTCVQGYYYDNSTSWCVLRCPTPTYGNASTLYCEECNSSCSSCSSYYTCRSCADNLTLYEGKCLSDCVGSTYLTEDKCEECDSNCLACVGEADNCTDCREGEYLLLGVCMHTCPKGYYSDVSDGLCVLCKEPCLECEGTSTYCTNCVSGYFWVQGQGVCLLSEECLNRSGVYPNSMSLQCVQCVHPCVDCSSSSLCSECSAQTYLYDGVCVTECPHGYYGQDSSCKMCPQQCESCTSPALCSACTDGYYLYQSECLSSCQRYFYPSSATGNCEACSYPCLQCYNLFRCISCEDELIYHNEQCLQLCPDSTYLFNGSCLDCQGDCLTCSQSGCLSCKTNSFFYAANQSCLSECPSTYYAQTITGTCEECSPPCVSCSSQTECKSCVDGYLFGNASCFHSCPVRTYEDGGACLSCPSLCLSCTSLTNCTQCDNAYLYDSQNTSVCVQECPVGMYGIGGECWTCSANCFTCAGSRINCTSCEGGMRLESGTCVSSCSQMFFYNEQKESCQSCGNSCSKCLNQTHCEECFYSYLNLETKACSQDCPTATYKNSQTFQCSPCPQGCLSCISSLVCAQCESSYVLYNIKCIQYPCPQSLFYYPQENKCLVSCSENDLLTDYTNKRCYSKLTGCDDGLVKKQQQCVNRCSKGEFINSNVECESGSSDHKFEVEVVCGDNYIWVYVLFGSDEVVVKDGWEDEFQVVVYGRNVEGERRMLVQDTDVALSTVTTVKEIDKQNAIALKVTFEEKLSLTTLLVDVQVMKPYRSMHYDGIPLQNWRRTYFIPYFSVDSIQKGTTVLAVIIITLAVVFTVLSLFFQSKPYLLLSQWEYLQFFYLLYFVDIQWPSTIGPFFSSFRIVHFRWSIFQSINNRLVYSPPKYYHEAGDISLLPNIGQSILISAIIFVFVVLCRVIGLFDERVQLCCEKLLGRWRNIGLVVGFFVYSNVLLFAAINVFYTPEEPFSNPISFEKVFSFVLLFVAFVVLLLIFALQWGNRNALDSGIDPNKKRIIVALPFYRVLRRTALVLSLAIHEDHSAYMISLGMISTAFLLAMVYWYQPFGNVYRYRLTLLEESMFLLFLLFVFVFVLNPGLSASYCIFLQIWAFLLFCSTIIYPSYCLYWLRKTGESPEPCYQIDVEEEIPEPGGLTERMKQKTMKIKVRKSVVQVDGQTDHEADESSQASNTSHKIVEQKQSRESGKTISQPGTSKQIKQFINYDIDDEDHQNYTGNQSDQVKKIIEARKNKTKQKMEEM